MKTIFNKILATLMAFVVLISTLSFTVDMHYCGGVLVETAIFQKAKGCGMEMKSGIAQENNKGCSITKKGCCTDERIIIDGQDELKVSDFDKLSIDQQAIVASYFYTYINLFEGLEKNIVPFKYYSPPLVVKNIQKLDETYLI